jgi:hypothetical protein
MMQLRKNRFCLFAHGSQLDNVVTSPWCDFRFLHLSVGDLLRDEVKKGIINVGKNCEVDEEGIVGANRGHCGALGKSHEAWQKESKGLPH